jgi:hypothetical protein
MPLIVFSPLATAVGMDGSQAPLVTRSSMPAKPQSKPPVSGDWPKDQHILQRSTFLLEDAQTLRKAVAQFRSALLRGRERDYVSVAQALKTVLATAEHRRCAQQLGAPCSKAGLL